MSVRSPAATIAGAPNPLRAAVCVGTVIVGGPSVKAPCGSCPNLRANRSSRTTMLMPDRRLLSLSLWLPSQRIAQTRPKAAAEGIALLFVVPALRYSHGE